MAKKQLKEKITTKKNGKVTDKKQTKLLSKLSAKDLKKITYKELFELDPVDLYNAIRENKIPKFPDKYWSMSDPDVMERVKPIVDYLFKNILRWSKNQIENSISCNTFKKHKLVGLYDAFDSSTIKLLNSVTNYDFSVARIKSYDKKISTIRKDLEWFVKKLIGEGLKTANTPVPVDKYTGYHVEYFINLKYFNPETPLKQILTDLHPELLQKYFTNKGTLRRGLKVSK